MPGKRSTAMTRTWSDPADAVLLLPRVAPVVEPHVVAPTFVRDGDGPKDRIEVGEHRNAHGDVSANGDAHCQPAIWFRCGTRLTPTPQPPEHVRGAQAQQRRVVVDVVLEIDSRRTGPRQPVQERRGDDDEHALVALAPRQPTCGRNRDAPGAPP